MYFPLLLINYVGYFSIKENSLTSSCLIVVVILAEGSYLVNLDGMYKVHLQMLNGKLVTVNANPFCTIQDLKQSIYALENIPVCDQRMIYGGRQLEDLQTLAQYNISQYSKIYVMERLIGGGGPLCQEGRNWCKTC